MFLNGQNVYYLSTTNTINEGKIILSKDRGYHWDIKDLNSNFIQEDVPSIHIFTDEHEVNEYLNIQYEDK